jgi:hypothetical protein
MVIILPVKEQVTKLLVPPQVHGTELLEVQNWVNNCAKVMPRMERVVIRSTTELQLQSWNQPRLAAVFMDIAAHVKRMS